MNLFETYDKAFLSFFMLTVLVGKCLTYFFLTFCYFAIKETKSKLFSRALFMKESTNYRHCDADITNGCKLL